MTNGHLTVNELSLPQRIIEKWQNIADTIVGLMKVPAALITCCKAPYLEVLAASSNEDNPFQPPLRTRYEGSGLYCEKVIATGSEVLISNAKDEGCWCEKSQLLRPFISYLGYPIQFPDGSIFGTICVLDRKENHFIKYQQDLVRNFRDTLQLQIELSYIFACLNMEPAAEHPEHESDESIPICSYCRKIRDEHGMWSDFEQYLINRCSSRFTHSICPDCFEIHHQKESGCNEPS